MIDELERLANLWKAGALTDEEFAEQKMRLFAAQAAAPPASSEPITVDMSSPDFPEAPEEEVVAPSTDDLLFDDLNALLEQAPADPLTADPIDAAEEPLQDEAAVPSDDDLLFDDLNALLENASSAPSLPDLSAAAGEEPAPADEAVLSFDDLNAMLDAELATMASQDEAPAPAPPPVPDAVAEATEPMHIADTPLPTEDDLLFDDLNALLADASDAPSADLPEISEAVPAEAPPVHDEGLPADDVLSFDDLNAMLDTELASMLSSETAPAPEEPLVDAMLAEDSPPAGDDDLLFDDLNAMLDAELENMSTSEISAAADDALPPVEVSRVEEVPLPADDDLLFDDLNAILAAEPVEASAPGEASRPVEELLANGAADDLDLSFDDRDAVVDAVSLDMAQPADAVPAVEAGPVEEIATVAVEPVSVQEPESDAAASKTGRTFPLGKIVAKLPRLRLPKIAFLQRLPQPVLLGLGAVALFTSSMGVGVALALATQSDAHPKGQSHGAAGAEEGSADHEADEAPSAEGASEHE